MEHKAHGNQLARPSWDVVNPNWDKLRKEAVVPKEIKHLRRQDIAVGPQGRRYGQTWQSRGFSSYRGGS